MRHSVILAVMAAFSAVSPAAASPYDPESSPQWHIPTLMRDIYRNPEVAKAAIAADQDFVAGMRTHHQGAVTMARAYLAGPAGNHPLIRKLANAIIANQEFEIVLLDDVGQKIQVPPRQIAGGWVSRQMGWDGLEHTWRFVKSPPPGFLDLWLDGTAMGEEEVRFAKGMIIHHQAAVDMARAYNANPAADNRILKALNRDIVVDQRYEIRLLERLIDRYPGNADTIVVDPATVPGMPHHGGMH